MEAVVPQVPQQEESVQLSALLLPELAPSSVFPVQLSWPVLAQSSEVPSVSGADRPSVPYLAQQVPYLFSPAPPLVSSAAH